MEVGVQRHASEALLQEKTPGTHFKEGWVTPRACLEGCGNSRPQSGFDPWTALGESLYRLLYATYRSADRSQAINMSLTLNIKT
jgi:hypothetical protein